MNANPTAPGIPGGKPLYVDPRGVASPNLSAPGIGEQVRGWAQNNRPSIDQLLREGSAAAPKAIPAAPSAPGIGSRVLSALNPMPAVREVMQAPGMIARLPGVATAANAVKRSVPGAAVISNGIGLYNQFDKSTDDFRNQTGIESGVVARTAGFLQDVGNAATFGQADRLGNWLAGNGYTASNTTGNHAPTAPALPAIARLPAPVPTLAPGEAARLGVSAGTGQSTLYAEPAPVAQFKAGQIQTKNAPLDPAAWTAENPSTFGAAPGIQVARKQFGNDTVRALKDAKGNVTFTNLADNQGMQQFASAGQGVSNNLNADGSRYDAGAHLARITQAEGELHQAKLAALEENVPGLRKRSTAEMLQERANSPLHAVRNQALAALTQQQQMAIGQQQHQSELALRAPGMQLDNAGKALGLQSHQQLASLQQQYLGLNDSNDKGGAQRKSLASQILTMQGKVPPGLDGNKFKVVEVGGGVDPTTMQALPKDAYLLNQETGQSQPFGEKSGKSLSQADYAELVKRYAAQGVNEETVKQHLASNGYQVVGKSIQMVLS